MDQIKLEQALAALPLLQYAFISPGELTFSQRVRTVCEQECPMYGKSWACPPAVGTVESCRQKCLQFGRVLLIATASEVADSADLRQTLATRGGHEAITREVRTLLEACGGAEVFVLSTEACARCDRCTYPHAPCRFPRELFPCVESHGIVVTELAERYDIDFLTGNTVVWFSLLFFNE